MLTWLFDIAEKVSNINPETLIDLIQNSVSSQSDELLDFAYQQPIATLTVAATLPLFAYKLYNSHFFSKASVNQTSLLGDNIYSYPLNDLFRTEDNYLLVIEEMLEMLTAQKRLYNPYTNEDLSTHDRLKLIKNKKIENKIAELTKKQSKAIKIISSETIEQLTSLAMGLLNGEEIWKGPFGIVPEAQTSYEKFIEYYSKMPRNEKKALDNLWLDKVDSQLIIVYQGVGRMQFKDLIASSAELCVHTIGLSVLQLIYQLDPKAKIELNSLTGKYLNYSISSVMGRNR